MNPKLLCLFFAFILQKYSAQVICFNPAPYSPVPVGTLGYKMCFGDFNLDGKKDVATIGFNSSVVMVSLSTGSGFSPPSSIPLPSNLTAIATGDFNNDGLPDLVTTGKYSAMATILLGNGNGTFGNFYYLSAGLDPVHIVVADFNNDGYTDLATSNYGDNTIAILVNNAFGHFPFINTYTVGPKPHFIVEGDFDNDGKKDLAVTGDSVTSFLKGNGTGTFQLVSTINMTFNSGGLRHQPIVSLFIDSDNRVDLAGISQNSLCILKNNGNFSFSLAVSNFSYTPDVLNKADFNNDGLADLVLNDWSSIKILLSTGLGGFTPVATYTLSNMFGPVMSLYSTDINNDLTNDLVVGQDNVTSLHVFLNCKGVGLDESAGNIEKLRMYPVPANNFLELKFENESVFKDASFTIYNDLGQAAMEGQLNLQKSRTESLIVEELPKGVYILRINMSQNATLSKRFVIAR